MKKIDNKGFLLTELLVTATIVSTVLIFLYVQFYSVKKGYEKSFEYNGVNELYALGNVREFLSDTGQIDSLVDMVRGPEKLFNPVPYTDIISNHLYGTNENYFNALITNSKIVKLYFMDEDITSVINYINRINDTEAAGSVATLKKFLGYIDYDRNGSSYRLVAEFTNGSFATLLVRNTSSIELPQPELIELPPIGDTNEEPETFDRNIEFNYSGDTEEYVIQKSGTYKIEVWGAQGGTSICNNSTCSVTPGYGGYSVGTINLARGTSIYVNVGGKGANGNLSDCAAGGYNGGGKGTNDGGSCGNANDDEAAGGGGGATHIALKTGVLSSLENDKDKVIIVAGGGGGASWTYTAGSGGGYLGGVNSTTSQTAVTQTTGNAFGQGQDASGYADSDGVGGGGGGWYGGYANNVRNQSAGSGGSGYINNSNLIDKHMTCYDCTADNNISTKTISNTCHNSEPTEDCSKEGNGFVRITYIETASNEPNTSNEYNIPSEYTMLSYIESTGTQYIDTGIYPKSTTKVEVDFALTSTTTSGGNGWGSSSYQESFLWGSFGNKFSTYLSSTWEYQTTNIALDTNKHKFELQSGSQKFDGVEFGTSTIGNTATSNQTMYLFAGKVEWQNSPEYFIKERIYEVKIYEENTLMRHFVPVINSSNQVGLYDLITETFYTNKGSGSFTAGPVVE